MERVKLLRGFNRRNMKQNRMQMKKNVYVEKKRETERFELKKKRNTYSWRN